MSKELANIVFGYPAIDNHCHPILSEAHKNDFSLEGIFTEAQGDAIEDAEYTLPGYRATKELAEFFGCEADWDIVKVKRKKLPYDDLCRFSFERTGIQCLLLDDGLDADGHKACEGISWHDQFTSSPSKRILRIEALAQNILLRLYGDGCDDTYGDDFEDDFGFLSEDDEASPFSSRFPSETPSFSTSLSGQTPYHAQQASPAVSSFFSNQISSSSQYPTRHGPRRKQTARKSANTSPPEKQLQKRTTYKASREADKETLTEFTSEFTKSLEFAASDPFVVGFKSIACYRTGLDVFPTKEAPKPIEDALAKVLKAYDKMKKMRIAEKKLNDYLVRIAMEIAGKCKKPIQFHTGLGDNDITLTKASPAHLQPLIKAFPDTPVVLLHSSYPYTREAGYLTAMYKNVFLDFGEIFPALSKRGQESVLHEILELCPTNKIMCSTDGHFWPETYYLAAKQSREALYKVLTQCIDDGMLTEAQAIKTAKDALFHNADRIYKLKLKPSANKDIS